jgi:hypothetical protein
MFTMFHKVDGTCALDDPVVMPVHWFLDKELDRNTISDTDCEALNTAKERFHLV